MGMKQNSVSGPFRDDKDEDRIIERRFSLLHCFLGEEIHRRKRGRPMVLVTQVAFNLRYARQVLHCLAIALKFENGAPVPARQQEVMKEWPLPHAAMRAKPNVNGREQNFLNELHQLMPDLEQFIRKELVALRRLLCRKGESSPLPETIIIGAIDAVRPEA
jgi:hypothetical protein